MSGGFLVLGVATVVTVALGVADHYIRQHRLRRQQERARLVAEPLSNVVPLSPYRENVRVLHSGRRGGAA